MEVEVTLWVIYDDDDDDDDDVCVVVVVDSYSPKNNQTRRISMNNKKLEVNLWRTKKEIENAK